MTPSELKARVEATSSDSKYFTRDNMKFSGDKMSNYGVRGPLEFLTNGGEHIQVYELFRRKPVKNGLQASAFFRIGTYKQTFGQFCDREGKVNYRGWRYGYDESRPVSKRWLAVRFSVHLSSSTEGDLRVRIDAHADKEANEQAQRDAR